MGESDSYSFSHSTYYPGNTCQISCQTISSALYEQTSLFCLVNQWQSINEGSREGIGIPVIFPWQPFSQSLHDRPPAARSKLTVTRCSNEGCREMSPNAVGKMQKVTVSCDHFTLPSSFFSAELFPINLPQIWFEWHTCLDKTHKNAVLCYCWINIWMSGCNYQRRLANAWCYFGSHSGLIYVLMNCI